jgi:hypothetical protein
MTFLVVISISFDWLFHKNATTLAFAFSVREMMMMWQRFSPFALAGWKG